jgi:hypothetical protein
MMPGDRKGETAANTLAKPIDCVDRTGNRVLWPTVWPSYLVLRLKVRVATTNCGEIVLEIRIIFAEIVPETQQVPPLAGAELGRAFPREVGHALQMHAQRLPVGAIGLAGRMGEIGALSLQDVSTMHRYSFRFSEPLELRNPVLAECPGRPD